MTGMRVVLTAAPRRNFARRVDPRATGSSPGRTHQENPMTAIAPAIAPTPRRIGQVLSGLAAAFLTFDATVKLLDLAPAVEGTAKVGYPTSVVVPLGIILAACVILYVVPRTAVLGTVLLTGYLGGAVATHVRIEDPLFSHILAPVYFGVIIWLGLYLRDARVRRLLATS
jgi:hypothetical protein